MTILDDLGANIGFAPLCYSQKGDWLFPHKRRLRLLDPHDIFIWMPQVINMSPQNKSHRAPLSDTVRHDAFEFDYAHNIILFRGDIIRLSPHEADILQVLLSNRARPTPMSVLIQRVYGAFEPDAAAASIRVAIHSLRRKIQGTGMSIRATPKVGYEIDATCIPELNRRLSDKILVALNVAKASGESDIAEHLELAYDIAEVKRKKWLRTINQLTGPIGMTA